MNKHQLYQVSEAMKRKMLATNGQVEDLGVCSIIIKGNDAYLIAAPGFENQNQKYEFIAFVNYAIQRLDADAYISFLEAWSLQEKANGRSNEEVNEAHKKGLVNHPDRVDSLIVHMETKSHCLIETNEIFRNDHNGVIDLVNHKTDDKFIAKDGDGQHATGLFANLMDPKPELSVPPLLQAFFQEMYLQRFSAPNMQVDELISISNDVLN